jgi:nucleolar protein 14
VFLIFSLIAEFVEDAHFGGGILKKSSSESHTRKDLIEQLIAESKKRKAEKQRTREQTIELTEKLDTEWKDLLPIVSSSKMSSSRAVDDHDKPDSYDTVMRQLKFEARGKVC